MNSSFEMEIQNLFGITRRGIVFRGAILQGTVRVGDKLEYTEDDGTRISVVVTQIMANETKKVFGILNYHQATKEISSAVQGQQVSIMVSDFFNISGQCEYSPVILRPGGGMSSKMSKTKTLRSFSGL
ncbi:MAG: hypothetical protein ABH891_02030 [Candidatus Omnitrophota bacterium]